MQILSFKGILVILSTCKLLGITISSPLTEISVLGNWIGRANGDESNYRNRQNGTNTESFDHRNSLDSENLSQISQTNLFLSESTTSYHFQSGSEIDLTITYT